MSLVVALPWLRCHGLLPIRAIHCALDTYYSKQEGHVGRQKLLIAIFHSIGYDFKIDTKGLGVMQIGLIRSPTRLKRLSSYSFTSIIGTYLKFSGIITKRPNRRWQFLATYHSSLSNERISMHLLVEAKDLSDLRWLSILKPKSGEFFHQMKIERCQVQVHIVFRFNFDEFTIM